MAEKKENKKLQIEIVKQMLTLATAGFGLVAALAWNSVIQTFVNEYIKVWIPGSAGIFSLLIYAVIVTVLAVLVTLQLSLFLEKLEQEKK